MDGRQIADLIEQLIDAKIKQHADPNSGGVPEINKIIGPKFNDKIKRELADLLDSRARPEA
jgi:hypothetical protein